MTRLESKRTRRIHTELNSSAVCQAMWAKPQRNGGLWIRGRRGHPDVHAAIVRFAKWLRTVDSFPVRVPVYLSPQAYLFRFCLLAVTILFIAGCTEMRVEGDAKVFQTSAVGTIIKTLVGIGLMLLGVIGLLGSVLPDRLPKDRPATSKDFLTSGQRLGLAMFGFAMGFIGLFLAGISFVFPNKLHVTVYPDRVSMASAYTQTGGNEVVIPFDNLASVELRREPNIVGKLKTYLVFTHKNSSATKQDAGNNELRAIETIQQALADYRSRPQPARRKSTAFDRAPSLPAQAPASSASPAPPSSPRFALKRYEISIPVPADYAIVGPDTIVREGTKLKACYSGSWSTVTAVAVNDDGTITCNWDSWPASTYRMMREDLTIPNSNGSSMAVASSTSSSASEYPLKRYEITIPIPEGRHLLAADTPVKIGTKLEACHAGRWESVTVVATNDDGTVVCNWDRWRAYTYSMMRDDLTIANNDAP